MFVDKIYCKYHWCWQVVWSFVFFFPSSAVLGVMLSVDLCLPKAFTATTLFRNGNFCQYINLMANFSKWEFITFFSLYVCLCTYLWEKKRRDSMLHKIFRYNFDEFKLITQKRECVQLPFNDSSNLNKMSFNRGIMGIPTRYPFVNYIQQRN